MTSDRLTDVRALFAARRWAAAYYLAGYAVECALKACIRARLSLAVGIIFEDRRFSDKCWTHNLEDLMRLTGLQAEFAAALATDADLLYNWDVVKDWSESSRYARATKARAEEL